MKKVCSLVLALVMAAGLLPVISAPVAVAAYSGDLSEYILESEHFFINPNIQAYLLDNVSPTKFNSYMAQMDLVYKEMLDFVGREPLSRNNKITMSLGTEAFGAMWVTIYAMDIIYWSDRHIVSHLGHIENDSFHIYRTTAHELGHLFALRNRWERFASEGWADALAYYTLQKCAGNSGAVVGRQPLDEYRLNHDGGIVYTYIHPLFVNDDADFVLGQRGSVWDNHSFERGWDILSKVFRSYNNGTYTPHYYVGAKTENDRIFMDFIDRCSFFAGKDIREFWSEQTKEEFDARFSGIEAVPFDPNSILVPSHNKNNPHSSPTLDNGYINLTEEKVVLKEGFVVAGYRINKSRNAVQSGGWKRAACRRERLSANC